MWLVIQCWAVSLVVSVASPGFSASCQKAARKGPLGSTSPLPSFLWLEITDSLQFCLHFFNDLF